MSQKGNRVSWEVVIFALVAIAYTYPYWIAHWEMGLIDEYLENGFVAHACQAQRVRLRLQKPIEPDVASELGDQLCSRLARVKGHFLAETQAVAPTKNRLNALEVVILRSRKAFEQQAPELGYDAGLLGQYIEVELAFADVSARAFLYMDGDVDSFQERLLTDFSSYSLVGSTFEHEYVHYLDSRFNIRTPFSGYQLEPRTLWWAEGLAEYFAEGEHNVEALPVIAEAAHQGESAIPSLKTIFRAKYQDVFRPGYEHLAYRWSYAVHRFLLEAGYKDHWLVLLEALRRPDRTQAMRDYHTQLDGFEERLDQPFKRWVIEHFGQGAQLHSSSL
jgi:hypothetical protein